MDTVVFINRKDGLVPLSTLCKESKTLLSSNVRLVSFSYINYQYLHNYFLQICAEINFVEFFKICIYVFLKHKYLVYDNGTYVVRYTLQLNLLMYNPI